MVIDTKTITIKNPVIAFLVFALIDIIKTISKVAFFIPVFLYLFILKIVIYSYVSALNRLIRMHTFIYDKVISMYGNIPVIKDMIKNDLKKVEV